MRWQFLFMGEVEPCINGQVATSGAYFGQDVRGIIDRLLREQCWYIKMGTVDRSFFTVRSAMR